MSVCLNRNMKSGGGRLPRDAVGIDWVRRPTFEGVQKNRNRMRAAGGTKNGVWASLRKGASPREGRRGPGDPF